jgi:hypothetical protein
VSTTPIAPDAERKLSPEEIERHWFENVYQGDKMRQLTARAILMGMALGMVMVCSNVYVGLKAGWSMGVAITSCVLAYAMFQAVSSTIGPLLVKAHDVPVVAGSSSGSGPTTTIRSSRTTACSPAPRRAAP